jgi:hypothetical protein
MLAKDISIMADGIDRLGQKIPDTPRQLIVLARLILIIGRRLEESLMRQLAPHGLNHSELVTLMFLYSRPDGVSTPTELCAVTWESTSNMTRIANALIERGLIMSSFRCGCRPLWATRPCGPVWRWRPSAFSRFWSRPSSAAICTGWNCGQ